MEEIILGFVQKKTGMIQKAKTKGELQEISKPPRPVYNGNGFTPGKYDTEEEELLVWSLTCLKAPLNNQAYERYKVSAKYSCGFPEPQVLPIIVADRYLDYFTTIMEARLWQVIAKPAVYYG